MIMIRIMIKIQNERKKKCWLRIFLVCSPCSPKPVSLRKRVCSPYQPCWRRPSCPAAPAQLQCGHGKLHAEGRCTHPATSNQPHPPQTLLIPAPLAPPATPRSGSVCIASEPIGLIRRSCFQNHFHHLLVGWGPTCRCVLWNVTTFLCTV